MSPRSDDASLADLLATWDDGPHRGAAAAAEARVSTDRVSADDEDTAPRKGAPLPLAAAVAALWATLLSIAPVLALSTVGALGAGADTGAVLRIGAGAWLLGHNVPVATSTDRITLVPLAITAWIGWRLVRAGVHASRAAGAHRAVSVWPAVRAGMAVALAYAAIGALVALLARTADVTVSPLRAALTFGVLSAATAVGGALGHGRSGRPRLRRVPRTLTDAVRAGVAAVAFLLAAGAAVGGLALALSGGEATQMLGAFHAGVAGQVGITALCLVYLPNLAVWGAAYLVGPGFAVGAGTVVSPGDVLLGPVPAVPVLAALPTGPLTGVGPALLGVPLIAGVAAGLLLGRAPTGTSAGSGGGGWGRLLGSAALAGPIAGALVHLAMVASRGSLGSGRLAELGAYDVRVALLAAVVIGVGVVVGAVTRRSLRRG